MIIHTNKEGKEHYLLNKEEKIFIKTVSKAQQRIILDNWIREVVFRKNFTYNEEWLKINQRLAIGL